MVAPEFPFSSLIPLPTSHTTEIIASAEIRGGFITTDMLGITRVWDVEGFHRGVLPPGGTSDFLVFPAVGGAHVCATSIVGQLNVYKCLLTEKSAQNGVEGPPLQLYATGTFRDGPVTNWAELVTCGFASEAAAEIYVGTSSGGIYHATRNKETGQYQGLPHVLRASDGFSCRGFTRNDAGDFFAILQNGRVEQLSVRRDRAPIRSSLGGNVGMVRVAPDGSKFAGIRLGVGGVISYRNDDEVVVCDAGGKILHELHAPYVGTLAIANDNLFIASDEEGLLKYDFQEEELVPLFENDPWGEEFSVMSLCILPAMQRVVVGGVDHAINNSVMQVWDWDGHRIAEEVRHLESLATMTPMQYGTGQYIIGTSSGGIWVIGTKLSQASQFFSLPSDVESVQILPVTPSTSIILGNHTDKDLDLEDNSGIAWLVDFSRQEPVEELEVYEPIIGGWYNAGASTARIFSRGSYQEVKVPSFAVIEEEKSYPVDDPDFVASSIVKARESKVWYAGTERGEVWQLDENQESKNIIDRTHALGPIETLALGPQDAPLLIAGFYRVIGIYWPQNNGFKKIYGLNSSINAIASHPTLPLFACGSVDGQIHLFDYNGDKLATLAPRHSKVITLLWTATAKLLAGYASGEVGTWDLSSIDIISGNPEKTKRGEKRVKKRFD